MLKGVFLLLLVIYSSNVLALDFEGDSPFEPTVQMEVLKKVCEHMGIDFNEETELPDILVSEEVKEKQAGIVAAADSQGMPFWAFERGINIYLFTVNKVILGKNMKIHNLAHEYTHYVQVKYKGYTLETFDESLEWEAVHIQNFFRD